MISIIDEADIREYPNKVQTVKTYSGLSTDSKPTEGVTNGSQFIELDSGKIFIFDKDSELWVEYGSGAKTGGMKFKTITITLETKGGGSGFETYLGNSLEDDGVVHYLIDNTNGDSIFYEPSNGYILCGFYQLDNPKTVVLKAFLFDDTPLPGIPTGGYAEKFTFEGDIVINQYFVMITGDCKITYTDEE